MEGQFGGKIISELEKGGLIFYNVNPFVNGNPWISIYKGIYIVKYKSPLFELRNDFSAELTFH